MATTYVLFDSFEHSGAPGCACPGCCLERAETGPARDEGDGAAASGPNAKAIDKLFELDLIERLGHGRWSDRLADEPKSDEQQATASYTPTDTDTGDADQAVDGLISGYVWDTTALTYSFPTSASDYETDYYNSTALTTVSGLNATQQDVVRYALDLYSAVSSLTFTELGDDAGEAAIDADLRLARSDHPGTAYAYYPSNNPVGGDSMYNTGGYNSPQIGNYAYHTFLHEIGHSLGLKHGHDTSGPGAVPYEMDSMEYTVMTYRSWVGKPLTYGYANETWGFSQSLMMLDIAAIQRLYGANFSTNSGNTTYTFSITTGEMFVDGVGTGTPGGNRVFRTIWDGDGTDTYDFSNYTTDLAVNLAPGEYVDLDVGGIFQRAMLDFGYAGNPVTYARGHVFNAMQYEGDARSLIENANGGSGNDSFVGNAADNVFHGNGGDDTFYGSDGADSYFGEDGIDSVVYDALFSSFTFSVSGTFLQIFDTAIDWVADSVEWLLFSDQTWAFGDLFTFASSSNTAPTAAADTATTDEDTAIAIAVLGNDSDTDGDSLTVTGATDPANGTVLVNGDGTITYTPDANFNGTDSFTYTISDGMGGSDTATVTVTVNPVNDAPDALDDAATTEQDSAVIVSVLANDTDIDGDSLTVSAVTDPAHGSVVNNGDGTVTYTPTAGYTGPDSFTYTVSDGNGGTDTATVTIDVTPVNHAPTAAADTAITDEDTAIAIAVLANDIDTDGDSLGVSVASGPANGTAVVNPDNTVTYTPDANFNGTDSFTYTVSDGRGGTDTATVTVTVNPVNDAPVAANDNATTDENTAVNIAVLANDSDIDGDTLGVSVTSGPANGAAVVNLDNTVTYTPDAGFFGSDSFTYTVFDGNGGTDTATVTVTVNEVVLPTVPEPVTIGFDSDPTGPYAGTADLVFAGLTVQANSTLNGPQLGATDASGDFTITAGALDFDFDSAIFRAVSGRVHVTIEAWDDGSLVGTDSFTTRSSRDSARSFGTSFDSVDEIRVIADGALLVDDLAFVTYTEIDPNGNNAPVAGDDSATTTESTTVIIDLLANDTDPDGDTLAVVTVDGQTVGLDPITLTSSLATVTMQPDGTFLYDPGTAFTGLYAGESAIDSFDYEISDGNGGTSTATVTVTVTGEGDPPPSIVIGFEAGTNQDGIVFTDTVQTNRAKGVVSGSWAGQSDGTDSLSFASADGSEFDFDSGYFTARDAKRTDVVVTGFRDGTQVAQETFTISQSRETFYHLDDATFGSVDNVVITASGGVIVDDLILFV